LAANPFSWLMGLFSLDIGIDLGTANTLVYVRNKGIIINEPSWVVVNKRTHEVIRVGSAAKEMVGRTPVNYVSIRPLRDGVISEFEITKAMLEYFINGVHQQTIVTLPSPRVPSHSVRRNRSRTTRSLDRYGSWAREAKLVRRGQRAFERGCR